MESIAVQWPLCRECPLIRHCSTSRCCRLLSYVCVQALRRIDSSRISLTQRASGRRACSPVCSWRNHTVVGMYPAQALTLDPIYFSLLSSHHHSGHPGSNWPAGTIPTSESGALLLPCLALAPDAFLPRHSAGAVSVDGRAVDCQALESLICFRQQPPLRRVAAHERLQRGSKHWLALCYRRAVPRRPISPTSQAGSIPAQWEQRAARSRDTTAQATRHGRSH